MIDFNRDYLMTIDGDLADSPSRFQAFNPLTNAVIASVPDASEAQLDAGAGGLLACAPLASGRRVERGRNAVVVDAGIAGGA